MQLDQIKDDETLMEFLGFFHTTANGLVQRKQPKNEDGLLPEQEAWDVHIYHLSGDGFFSEDDEAPVNTFMLKDLDGMRKGHVRYLIRTDLELEKVFSALPAVSYGVPVFRTSEGSTPYDEWAVVEVGYGQTGEVVRGLFVDEFEKALKAFVTYSSDELADHYVDLVSKAYKKRAVHVDRINSMTLKNLDHAMNEYNAKRSAIVTDHRDVTLTVHQANEVALKRTGSTFSYMRYEDRTPAPRARPLKHITTILGRKSLKSGPLAAIWRTVNDEKPAPYAIYNTDYEVWLLV